MKSGIKFAITYIVASICLSLGVMGILYAFLIHPIYAALSPFGILGWAAAYKCQFENWKFWKPIVQLFGKEDD